MEHISIVLPDNDIFITDDSNLIDSPFYIQIGSFCFPDAQWIDFPYPVLCEWAEDLLRNRGAEQARYELYFHDGPYRLDIVQTNDAVSLRAVCFRDGEKTLCSANTTCTALLTELADAMKTLKTIIFENEVFDRWPHRAAALSTLDHYRQRISDTLK